MLKYTDAVVTFAEIPNEISLCLNISNCPYKCPGCHSKYLWEDVGTELTKLAIIDLVDSNKGVSCICFMGGDCDLDSLIKLAEYIKNYYPNIRTAWYTGNDNPEFYPVFDYIKVGPYKEEFGPLNSPRTNQRFYIKGSIMNKPDANPNGYYDRTDLFWINNSNT